MIYTVNVTYFERDLEVELDIDYQKGEHTLANGDPGYPDMVDVEMLEVYHNGVCYLDILERAVKLGVIESGDIYGLQNKAEEKLTLN